MPPEQDLWRWTQRWIGVSDEVLASKEEQHAPAFQTDMDKLLLELEAFDGCLLKKTARSTVFYDGKGRQKILLVGEAPGEEEDKQGKPFVGASGKFLDKMLFSIGLTREDVRIVNVVPWRPPGNRPPTAEEIAQCQPFLKRHIDLFQPKTIVTLGSVATKALTNRTEPITRLQGQWMAYGAVPLLALFHPSYVLRSPSQKRFVWDGLLTLRAALENPA